MIHDWNDVLDEWVECELCEDRVPSAWAEDQDWKQMSFDGGDEWSLLCADCVEVMTDDDDEQEVNAHEC